MKGDPDWIVFRKSVIAKMLRDGAFHYIEHDRLAGGCPVCRRGVLGVRFIGRTPAANFICHSGCGQDAIAERLGHANDHR